MSAYLFSVIKFRLGLRSREISTTNNAAELNVAADDLIHSIMCLISCSKICFEKSSLATQCWRDYKKSRANQWRRSSLNEFQKNMRLLRHRNLVNLVRVQEFKLDFYIEVLVLFCEGSHYVL